jgi:choline dehydrogenase
MPPSQADTETFDYVVVGGGTAGCIVASRLAMAGDASVLLLEAGGSDLRPMVQIPIGYARLLFDKDVNWLYETEPDAGLAGRRSFWPRGKVLGGSGSINAMVYMRGLPHDFDDWRAMGNVGWGYDDVLPFFKSVEDHDDGDPRYHGRGGLIHVTDVSRDVHPLCDRYIASCEALGFPATPDFNSERGEGVGIYQINTRSGFRSCSANEHLRGARKAFMKEHGTVFWVLGMMQYFWYSSDKRRERFVTMCDDKDVQELTWQAYMHKKLVRAKPMAHVKIFMKDTAHLLGLRAATR